MKSKTNKILIGIIVVLMIIFAFKSSLVVFRQIYRDSRFIFLNTQFSYDDKMKIYWWTVYDLFQFVKQHTPTKAVIAIPPQDRPFLTSGNSGIADYFLYPRKAISGTFSELPNNQVDYVLLTYGEWADASPDKYGWPKFNIKAKRVFIFDPENKKVVIKEGDYNYEEYKSQKTYGLIEVQK